MDQTKIKSKSSSVAYVSINRGIVKIEDIF